MGKRAKKGVRMQTETAKRARTYSSVRVTSDTHARLIAASLKTRSVDELLSGLLDILQKRCSTN